MLKKRWVKIGLIILVVVTLISNNTDIFGAINEDYYDAIKSSMVVDNTRVDSSVKSSVLLDAISILVYSVGSMLEKILGSIFQAMSGDNVFPWADAILFNAIPMLDINIFNPSGTSIVAMLQQVVMDTYYTIFMLALAFFGIAIMVTAIKLVVSTIASEKAAYKQAIMKWLMGFVLICGIHFFMAFVIYLNEQLVIVAQNIASEQIGDSAINIAQLLDTDESSYKEVENFLNSMTTGYTFNWKTLAVGLITTAVAVTLAIALPFITAPVAAIVAFAATGTAISVAGGFAAPFATAALTNVRYVIDESLVQNISLDDAVETLTGNYLIANKLLENSNYDDILEQRLNLKLRGDDAVWTSEYKSDKAVILVAADVAAIAAKAEGKKFIVELEDTANSSEVTKVDYIELLRNYIKRCDELPVNERVVKTYKEGSIFDFTVTYYKNESDKAICSSSGSMECNDTEMYIVGTASHANPKDFINYDTTFYNHAKIVTQYYDNFDTESGTISSSTSGADGSGVIASLANAFKDLAWENTATSWKPTRVSIEGALLYAILVAQSLIFFIAYAKRLFYIIILIVMAPIVVVYDFFTKF